MVRLQQWAGSTGRAEQSSDSDGADFDGSDSERRAVDGRPVLVTEFLDPALAPLLPLLAGVVSESGSMLSHLAILAREYGVPCVVAVPDARRRFPPGTVVSVDGGTGVVEIVDADGPARSRVDGRPAPATGRPS